MDHTLWVISASDTCAAIPISGQALEHPALILTILEVWAGDWVARKSIFLTHLIKSRTTVRLIERHRAQKNRIDDTEHRRVRAAAVRQRDLGDQSETGGFLQHSGAVPQVLT